jgi:ABC-type transport system involved in multi-copper enzyme maturation permease subunit
MRDVWLVARFEVLRAIRTWRAVALLVLYAVASGGAAWLFTRLVWLLENTVARQLGVAETEIPGAMLDKLVASDTWREVVGAMVGAPHLVDRIVQIPPLAMFELWFGFLLVPFFAASASAECLAIDVQSRAIRYEALRTGRLELVLGRFAGQLALTFAATLLSVGVAWGVGLGFMIVERPVELLGWLVAFAPRAWVFSIPFVAIGVAASQVTASPAWARVLAIGGTAGSWILFGLARWAEAEEWLPLASDLVLQVLPQGWLRGLWEPGAGWLASGAACLALAGAVLAAGYVRFARRDL